MINNRIQLTVLTMIKTCEREKNNDNNNYFYLIKNAMKVKNEQIK